MSTTNTSSNDSLSKEWKENMSERNKLLDEIRKNYYSIDSDDGSSYIDESGGYWSSHVFKNYGHIIDNEEYNTIKKTIGEDKLTKDISDSLNYYKDGIDPEFGVYYASNILFDGDVKNDEEAIKILIPISYYHENRITEDDEYQDGDEGDPGIAYYYDNPIPSADFVLGKYQHKVLNDKEKALDYYNEALIPESDVNAKKCYVSSCLDMVDEKIQETDADFLKKLSLSIHNKKVTGDFTAGLDRRLETKNHPESISASTWVDAQSSLVLEGVQNGYIEDETISFRKVWERTKNHLKNNNLETADAISLLQKTVGYTPDSKKPLGYVHIQGAKAVADLYIDNRLDIKGVNDVMTSLSKDEIVHPKTTAYAYLATIITITNSGNKKLTEDEINQITDYVAGGYDGKISGETLSKSIIDLERYGVINKDRLKSGLRVEDYSNYLTSKLDIKRNDMSSYEVADSLLYVETLGTEKDILTLKSKVYEKDNKKLYNYIKDALEDKKVPVEDRISLLRNYTAFLNNKNNDLSEEEQKELDKISTNTFRDYIKEEAAAKNEDVLKTIDRLVSEGKITAAEAKDIKIEMLRSGEIPITDTEMEPVEFEVNGEKIKMDFTASGWYDKILNFSFKNNKSGAKEIVDVVSEYGWMNNTTNKNTSSDFIKHNNIPYCYAVEYRQLYNASISNIILSFLGLAYSAKGAASGVYNLAGSAIDGIIKLSSPLVKMITGGSGDDNSNKSTTLTSQDGGQTTDEKNTSEGKESWLDKTGNLINSWAIEGDKYFRGAMEKVAYLDSRGPIATGRKSGLLNPYRMMYILSKTNKQYCFPMLDKSASSYKVANKMDEADGGQGSSLLGNRFFGMVANLAQTVLGIAQDINQIAPFFQSAIGNGDNIKSMRQYHIERSKFFSFPTDGEDIEVSFILFNTVKKNIWKKHFNFIFGFVLRNLPFKHDLVSYYPPLFYDVIVPGVKRCPYCYVERIDVSPLGLMRNMSMSSEDIGLPDLTNGGGKMNYTVNVPEAWQVKIVFKSLIATSGNQILSGFVDMPIQASSSNDSLKNKNENKK